MSLIKNKSIFLNKKVYPQYDGLSLINISHTILSHFGAEPFRPTLPNGFYKDLKDTSNVVLFLIDGLGWNLFEKASKTNNFFKTIIKNRKIHQITSVFPPSTPAALTSLNTGLTPKEHGIIEWFLYFKNLDSIIRTIPYEKVNTIDDKEKNPLPDNPKILFNGKTIFEYLAEKGIRSYCFLPEEYKDTVYTRAVMREGIIVPYSNLKQLMQKLKNKLKNVENSYFYIYIPSVDSLSHDYGPASINVQKEVIKLANTLKTDFLEKLDDSTAKKTGIILVADHGQFPINPLNTIYIDKYQEIISNLNKTNIGKTIFPTGNPRNVFLSVKKEKIKETVVFLKALLKNKAEVILMNQKVINKLYGTGVSHKDFLNRIGNILILPNGKNMVWLEYLPSEKITFLGHHGGLGKDAMVIPLVISKASDLIY